MIRLALRLTLLFSLGLGLAACGDLVTYTPESTGQVGHVLVVADSATWAGPVGDAVRETLGGSIVTLPRPEPHYTLQRIDLGQRTRSTIERRHSVLFIAPHTEDTPVGRFVRGSIGESRLAQVDQTGRGLFRRPNLWSSNQMVVFATAADAETLAAQVRADADVLRDSFAPLHRRMMARDMFRTARQTDLEDDLLERHGVTVAVQHDYFVAQDTTFITVNGNAGTFLRLRRIPAADSWRDMFIYFEEDPQLNRLHPDSVVVVRNRLSRQFVRGSGDSTYIRVEDRFPERRPILIDSVSLNGRFALETRGTWYLAFDDRDRSAGMGGPFVNYSFYDEDTGRFVMIDGMIFAPNYPLREFLRQMEVIAHTFRTRDDTGVEVFADREPEAEPPPPAD